MASTDERDPVFNFSVSEDLKRRLLAYAKDQGIPQSHACRVLISGALADLGYPKEGPLR